MTFEDYFHKYPEGRESQAYLLGHAFIRPGMRDPLPGVLDCGMLQFTPKSAPELGGPFPGGCAVFVLRDTRKVKVPMPNEKELYTGRMGSLAACGTFWTRHRAHEVWAQSGQLATLHQPIELHIAGNDDFSWSRYFETRGDARKFLEAMKQREALDLRKDLLAAGFVFTN